MILELTGVRRDATVPAGTIPQKVPVRQDIVWPRGEDGTLQIACFDQDGTAVDLTGGALVFGMREFPYDLAALISRQATVAAPLSGLATVDIVRADTISLNDETVYFWDLQFTDASGKRWQFIPESAFQIASIYAQPGDAVTIPASSTPLALGPSWLDHDIRGGAEWETDGGTTEQVVDEWVWNFDDATASLANVYARQSALAWVSGGTGTIRVRVGGTAGAADGTVLLTSDPVTGTSAAAISKTATVAKPVGTQIVKATLQNNTNGQRTRIRGATVTARGAA